jgi:hypothetical protein
VNIHQLISKIKLKRKVCKKRNVTADREAAYASSKAAAVFSDRSIRWRVTAASIAAKRRQNGEIGKPGASTGKLIMGRRFAVLRVADTECGSVKKRNKRPRP